MIFRVKVMGSVSEVSNVADFTSQLCVKFEHKCSMIMVSFLIDTVSFYWNLLMFSHRRLVLVDENDENERLQCLYSRFFAHAIFCIVIFS